jgi:hypothetical protein
MKIGFIVIFVYYYKLKAKNLKPINSYFDGNTILIISATVRKFASSQIKKIAELNKLIKKCSIKLS